jgi:hypothetical protein
MTKHFSEADLLETYYMQPGESMPVMMHLAACADCASRYDRLDRKLREVAACKEKPESFWDKQRHAIMVAVGSVSEERSSRAPLRVAAAAVLLLGIGGFAMWRTGDKPAPPQATAQPAVVEQIIPTDPWESKELEQFHPVIEWESWVTEEKL